MGPFQGLIGQDDCLVVNVHTTNALLTDPLLPGKTVITFAFEICSFIVLFIDSSFVPQNIFY